MKSHSKAPGSLVALASAAIMAVYGAGYARTRAAASRFTDEPAVRRPHDAQPATPAVVGTPLSTAAVPDRRRPAPTQTQSSSASRASSQTAVRRPAAAQPVAPAANRTQAPGTAKPAQASSALPDQAPPPVAAASTSAAVAAETRAADSAEPATPAAPTLYPKVYYQDGTFTGWGSSRHGDIQATVVITNGRIMSATITQCLTRYSCSLIAHLQGQVVTRQSPDVDFVSGATQSVDAFYYAVVEALSKAK